VKKFFGEMKNFVDHKPFTQVVVASPVLLYYQNPLKNIAGFFFCSSFFLGFGVIFKDFWFLLSMYNSLGLHSSSLLAICGHSTLYSFGPFFECFYFGIYKNIIFPNFCSVASSI
jgi:hypothetical protein